MVSRYRRLVRRSILFFAFVGLCVAAVFLIPIDVIPKPVMTQNAMMETAVRIAMYYQQNKHLSPDLSVLPVREDHLNRTTDGWNRPLRYTIDSGDTFTLSSLGEDGVPGGTGDNADVICKYRIE